MVRSIPFCVGKGEAEGNDGELGPKIFLLDSGLFRICTSWMGLAPISVPLMKQARKLLYHAILCCRMFTTPNEGRSEGRVINVSACSA
jgi:hypothetical protein